MTEQEALERINQEYPEFTQDAEQMIRDGKHPKELVSILDSFY